MRQGAGWVDTPVLRDGQQAVRRHFRSGADWRNSLRGTGAPQRSTPCVCFAHGESRPPVLPPLPYPVTLVLLAGGRSRRMGTDKALMPFLGTTLLRFQLEHAALLGVTEVLVSAGENAAGLQREAPQLRIIPDDLPDRGPLGGIAACLRRASSAFCLTLPVDVPFLPAEALAALCGQPDASPVLQLEHGGGREPLIARWRSDVWREAEHAIRSGPVAAHRFLAALGAASFSAFDPPLEAEHLQNLNAPADLPAGLITR